MINNCLEDGEREEAEKKLKNGTITLQITNSEGKTESKEVHDIEEWEKYSDWNKFILIPVLVTTDASSSNSYYGSSSNVISIQHDLKPGYARLKGGSKGSIQDAQGNPLYPEYQRGPPPLRPSSGQKGESPHDEKFSGGPPGRRREYEA